MTTLTPSLTLADPQVCGPLAVFPILGPEPRLAYRTLARAVAAGAIVKELDGEAVVNDLLVDNVTDQPLLIYDGEEVLGAQQNRTFDLSALLGAGERVELPVSCVEHGRWDSSRSDDCFDISPQAPDPSLRAMKRIQANLHAASGAVPRANQGAVWDEVAARLDRHDVASDTSALHDAFDHKGAEIDELLSVVHAVERQLGAVAAVRGRPVALDLVSRPDAFADLLPRLARGYALEALGVDSAVPDHDAAEAFLTATLEGARTPTNVPGIARGFAVRADGIVGAGLEHEGELVQLSAFPRAP